MGTGSMPQVISSTIQVALPQRSEMVISGRVIRGRLISFRWGPSPPGGAVDDLQAILVDAQAVQQQVVVVLEAPRLQVMVTLSVSRS